MSIEGISIFLGVIAAIGGIVARDRYILRQISDGVGKVHERIDNIPYTYVQKEDLRTFLKPIEENIKSVNETQKETNKRIDELMIALTSKINQSQG